VCAIPASTYRTIATDSLDCPEVTHVRGATGFDFVACLNVLDRCTHPLTLMRQLHAQLSDEPHARLLMAVVLPFRPTPQQEFAPIYGRSVRPTMSHW
jgi:hypothetical protein